MHDYRWYHGAKVYDQDTDRRRHGETRLARPRIHTRNIVYSRAFRGRLRREFSSGACPRIGASCVLCSPDDALNAARFTVTHGCAFTTRGRLAWDVLSGGDEKGRSRKRRGKHMVQDHTTRLTKHSHTQEDRNTWVLAGKAGLSMHCASAVARTARTARNALEARSAMVCCGSRGKRASWVLKPLRSTF